VTNSTTNLYYFDPHRIDLAKLREQATAVAVGTYHRIHSPGPQSAIIHHHDHADSCKGMEHERYDPVDGEDKVQRVVFFPEAEAVMR
jgi:hypothetical protein